MGAHRVYSCCHELAPKVVAMHIVTMFLVKVKVRDAWLRPLNGCELCIAPLSFTMVNCDLPMGFLCSLPATVTVAGIEQKTPASKLHKIQYLWQLGGMVNVRLVHQALSAMTSAAADCFHHVDSTVTFATVGIHIIRKAAVQCAAYIEINRLPWLQARFVILLGLIMPW